MLSLSECKGEIFESNVFFKKLKCEIVHLLFFFVVIYSIHFLYKLFVLLKQKIKIRVDCFALSEVSQSHRDTEVLSTVQMALFIFISSHFVQ